MSSAAKTVSFSPLRRGYTSFKNTLDSPIKLKWPDVSAKATTLLLKELERSLSGMKGKFKPQPPTQKHKRKKHKQTNRSLKRAAAHKAKEDRDESEPPKKKICLESEGNKTDKKNKSTLVAQLDSPRSTADGNDKTITVESTDNGNIITKVTSLAKEDESLSSIILSGKKSQMIVGVNCVTRSLERGELCAGLVCLSAKPALVTRHIMMLAATRSVPFAALPNLSQKVVELLGDIRSALAIGFKKTPPDETNYYSEVIDTISKHAPLITVPWLSPVPSGTLTHKQPDKSTADKCNLDPVSVQCDPAQPKPESTASELTSTSIAASLGCDSPLTATYDDHLDQEASRDVTRKASSLTSGNMDKGRSNKKTDEDEKEAVSDSRCTSVYSPLQIKKTIVKSKKRNGPKKREV